MFSKPFKQFSYLLISIFLTLGLSLALQSLLAAWTAPTSAPPNGNVSAPINESTTDQVKLGGLGIGGSLAVTGNSSFSGNIGIGTTPSSAKIQINAPVGTEALRIISASDYSPLNIRNNADTADIFRVDQAGVLQVGSVPWARMPACAEGEFIQYKSGAWSCSSISPTFDFTLDSNPTSGSVSQGGSIQSTITATLQSAASQTVTFSATGLPTGAQASFSVPACNPTCATTMTIATSLTTTPVGSYLITITGNGGGVIKTTTYTLQVIGPKYVFVTSTSYNGNLGGLAGADGKCMVRASAAGLSGTWKAWLSDSNTSAASRLIHHSGPYKLLNSQIIANDWQDLIDGTLLANKINITEVGSSVGSIRVWTNTDASGNIISSGGSCNNWSDSSFSFWGWYGNTSYTSVEWTKSDNISCGTNAYSLYCFQQ